MQRQKKRQGQIKGGGEEGKKQEARKDAELIGFKMTDF